MTKEDSNAITIPTELTEDEIHLRDAIAMQAMQGILNGRSLHAISGDSSRRAIAKRAYSMADTMMEIREEIL